MTDKKIVLPDGYYFADRQSITTHEFAVIRRSLDWDDNDEERWHSCLQNSIEVCGVRDKDGMLVGIGFIAGNHRHAILCDFNVHKKHQGKGIGKAILQQRIRRTEELKIPYLYVSLHPSNPLRKLYEDYGFQTGSNSMFRTTTY